MDHTPEPAVPAPTPTATPSGGLQRPFPEVGCCPPAAVSRLNAALQQLCRLCSHLTCPLALLPGCPQLCKSKFGAAGKAAFLAAVDEARSSCPMKETDPCDPACKAALQAVSQQDQTPWADRLFNLPVLLDYMPPSLKPVVRSAAAFGYPHWPSCHIQLSIFFFFYFR